MFGVPCAWRMCVIAHLASSDSCSFMHNKGQESQEGWWRDNRGRVPTAPGYTVLCRCLWYYREAAAEQPKYRNSN